MSLKIIFIGTTAFALPSLEALIKAGANILAVVTAPDRPSGRGRKLRASAVKQYAMEHGLNLLQPEKLQSPAFLEELRLLQADLQVVVAFRMLPKAVWSMPPKGTINLHASLLPHYRGAAPIHWALINGEKESGVSTFFIKHEIDTGDMLFMEKVPIQEDTTAGDLHDQLMHVGASLLVKTVQAIESGIYKLYPQATLLLEKNIKHAPKILKEHGLIDWNKTTDQVYNLIRGLSPYPGAFTYFRGKTFKILRAKKEHIQPLIPQGEFLTDGVTYLKFACPDGFIAATEVQLASKKHMCLSEFLRGIRCW